MKKMASLFLVVAMAAALLPSGPVIAYGAKDAYAPAELAIEDSAQVAASPGSLDENQRLDKYVNGTIPIDKNVYVVNNSALYAMDSEDEFPVSYRSDEQPWATNVRVKDQLNASIC